MLFAFGHTFSQDVVSYEERILLLIREVMKFGETIYISRSDSQSNVEQNFTKLDLIKLRYTKALIHHTMNQSI